MLMNWTTSHYAQVGWFNDTPHGWNTFVEYYDPNEPGNVFELWFGTEYGSPGAEPLYRVTYSNGAFQYFINTTEVWSDTAYFTPNGGQIFGEIHSLADQMPGGVNDPEDFNNSEIRYGTTWDPYNGTKLNYSSSYFNIAEYSNEHLQVGDRYCSS